MLKKILISILALVVLTALVSGMFRNYVNDSNLSGSSSDVQTSDVQTSPLVPEPGDPVMPDLITYAPAGESILELDPGDAENVVYNSAAQGFTVQRVDEDPTKYWDDNIAIKLDVEPNTTYKLIWRVSGFVMAYRPAKNIYSYFGYSFGGPTINDDEWLGKQMAYGVDEQCSAMIETGENTELYFYLFQSYDGFADEYGNIDELLSISSFGKDVQFALIKQS